MALTHWGFIYTADGSAAGGDVRAVDTGTCRSVFVGVEKPEEGIEAARRLVAEGVQLIELCGGSARYGPGASSRRSTARSPWAWWATGPKRSIRCTRFSPDVCRLLHF